MVTTHKKGSRGSDPRPLSLTMGWLLDAYLGSDPCASRIVQARGLDQPARMREVVCHRSEWPASLRVDTGFAVATTLQTKMRLPTRRASRIFGLAGLPNMRLFVPKGGKGANLSRDYFCRAFVNGKLAIDRDCSA